MDGYLVLNNSVFDKLGVEHMSFMVLYAVIIFIASSHFVFTSKNGSYHHSDSHHYIHCAGGGIQSCGP